MASRTSSNSGKLKKLVVSTDLFFKLNIERVPLVASNMNFSSFFKLYFSLIFLRAVAYDILVLK